MSAEKCPDCGIWWRGMEHRCAPALTSDHTHPYPTAPVPIWPVPQWPYGTGTYTLPPVTYYTVNE